MSAKNENFKVEMKFPGEPPDCPGCECGEMTFNRGLGDNRGWTCKNLDCFFNGVYFPAGSVLVIHEPEKP